MLLLPNIDFIFQFEVGKKKAIFISSYGTSQKRAFLYFPYKYGSLSVSEEGKDLYMTIH